LASSASSIGFACIPFRFRERRVPEYGHDLVRGGAGVGQSAAESLPQTMGLAIDRQSGRFDRLPHELGKAGNCEGPTERGVDNGNVISRSMVESAAQLVMKIDVYPHASLASRVSDARRDLVDLTPRHSLTDRVCFVSLALVR
jgi:hypothetical protein